MSSSTLRSIQWLRGVAVLSVLLYHVGFFAKGYIGVDLFFAISGFVILNSIFNKGLFTQNSNSKKDLIIFLKKRFWRIYPALFCVITFTLFYSIFQITWLNNSQKDVTKYGVSSFFSLANLFSYRNATNYFEAGNTSKPLLHLWSVSVEIQLYLFFGTLLLLISFLKVSKTTRDLVLIFSFVLAITFSQFFAADFYSKLGLSAPEHIVFYSPLDRSWQFLFGCLIYILYIESKNQKQKFINGVLVFFCVIYMLFLIDSNTLKLTFLGFAVFIHFSKYLSFKTILAPLAHIGDRSYSIYLWHMPVIYFFYISRNSILNLIITLVLIYLLSHLTYRHVEQKYRGGFKDSGYKKVLVLSSIPVFLAIFLYFGFSEQIVKNNVREISIENSNLASAGWEQTFGDCTNKNVFNNYCTRDKNFLENIIVGDSHAGSFVQATNIYFPNKPFQFKASFINPGCSMTLPNLGDNKGCTTALSKLYSVLARESNLKLHYSEDYQLYGSLHEQLRGNVGCSAYMPCAFEGYINSEYGDKLMQNLKDINEVNNQGLVLIGASPRLVSWPNQFNLWNLVVRKQTDVYSEFSSEVATRINFDLSNRVKRLNDQGLDITFIDPTIFICAETKENCKVFSGRESSLYWDADHLSVSGAQAVFDGVNSR